MSTISAPNAVELRYYPRDGTMFLDTHYLIRGVAGAVLWKLARAHVHEGRREFSLRELRLAGDELNLPEIQDNLSVRVLLLQRRLAERAGHIAITKVGRGRYRLDSTAPLRLVEVATEPAPAPVRAPTAAVADARVLCDAPWQCLPQAARIGAAA